MVRFLRAALTGEKVTQEYETFAVQRLQARHACRREPVRSWSPRCARACCGSPGARATARSSTGCRPTTCSTVAPIVQKASPRRLRRSWPASSSRRRPMPTRCAPRASSRSRRTSTCPVYAAFHEWLGRGDELAPMWQKWKDGDRKARGRRHPRLAGRRADRSRAARGVPGAHPALHRQRRRHARAGVAAVRRRNPPSNPRPRARLSRKSMARRSRRAHAVRMLTEAERRSVLDAIHFYGWLPTARGRSRS